MNLEDLIQTDKECFYRIWNDRQIIEIWTDSALHDSGRVINWVYECSEERKTAKVFYKEYALNKIQANQMKRLILQSGITRIGSDEQIEDWQHGFDGYSVEFEFSNDSFYSFKSYWGPKYQYRFEESIIINTLIDSTENFLSLDSLQQDFDMNIPFECYTWHGPMMISRFLPLRRKIFYRRLIRNSDNMKIVK